MNERKVINDDTVEGKGSVYSECIDHDRLVGKSPNSTWRGIF